MSAGRRIRLQTGCGAECQPLAPPLRGRRSDQPICRETEVTWLEEECFRPAAFSSPGDPASCRALCREDGRWPGFSSLQRRQPLSSARAYMPGAASPIFFQPLRLRPCRRLPQRNSKSFGVRHFFQIFFFARMPHRGLPPEPIPTKDVASGRPQQLSAARVISRLATWTFNFLAKRRW